MPYTYTLTSLIPATPQEIYEAWLDSVAHSEMTGGEAAMSDELGAEVSAWNGYISGRNLELVPGERIVQSWRTSKFDDEHEDSIVTITFEPAGEATLMTVIHSNVPDAHRSYEEGGWESNYFEPMKVYFAGLDKDEEEDDGEEAAQLATEQPPQPVGPEAGIEPQMPARTRARAPAPRKAKKTKKAAPRAKAAAAKKKKKPPAAVQAKGKSAKRSAHKTKRKSPAKRKAAGRKRAHR